VGESSEEEESETLCCDVSDRFGNSFGCRPGIRAGDGRRWRQRSQYQVGDYHRRVCHGDCPAVCGYSQSKATVAACEGLARNPGARPGIQFALILALVLIESMALYTFAIIFAKVKIV
jgi:F0F1-type ATP synthase membrane subunit c/vacuolar-type H+-ATPase subunit K